MATAVFTRTSAAAAAAAAPAARATAATAPLQQQTATALTLTEPAGRVYVRDFEVPKQCDRPYYKYKNDLTCFAIKFDHFQFALPGERTRRLHQSEAFRLEKIHSLYIYAPDPDTKHAYIIVKRESRQPFSGGQDIIVQYGPVQIGLNGDSGSNSVLECATILSGRAQCREQPHDIPADLKEVLARAHFENTVCHVFRFPDEITDKVLNEPGHDLTVLIQIERRFEDEVPLDGFDRDVLRPDGAFCNLVVRVVDEKHFKSDTKLFRVHANVMAGRSGYFRNELKRRLKKYDFNDTTLLTSYDHAAAAAAAAGVKLPPPSSCLQHEQMELRCLKSAAFDRILQYIYEGYTNIVDLNFHDARNLYEASVELAIPELQKPVLDRIAFLLSDGKYLFEGYSFAHQYDIFPLIALIEKILRKFGKACLHNGEWSEFKDARPDLVAKLVRAAATERFSH